MTTRYEVRIDARPAARDAERFVAAWRDLVRASAVTRSLVALRRAQLSAARRRRDEALRRIGG